MWHTIFFSFFKLFSVCLCLSRAFPPVDWLCLPIPTVSGFCARVPKALSPRHCAAKHMGSNWALFAGITVLIQVFLKMTWISNSRKPFLKFLYSDIVALLFYVTTTVYLTVCSVVSSETCISMILLSLHQPSIMSKLF